MNLLVPFILALGAYTLLSSGLLLMKFGIPWTFREAHLSTGRRRRLFFLWLLGFLLSNLCVVPQTMALKTLPAPTVSAMAGWGILVLVFGASLLLKERISGRQRALALLVVLSLALVPLLPSQGVQGSLHPLRLLFVSLLPLVPLSLLKVLGPSKAAVLWASVSGYSAAMIVLLLKALTSLFGLRISLYFESPWLYLYLFFSLLSFLSLQMAYRKGKLITVGPLHYSLSLLLPLPLSTFVFHQTLPLLLWPLLFALAAASGLLLRENPESIAP